MNQRVVPQVVTIAGSDSGGGAGIQADLKTFQARHVFGMNVVIALTAQNTLGVQAALAIPEDFICAQFDSLEADFVIRAAKTGMLSDSNHVRTVVQNLKQVHFGPLVVDPVMVAKGGHHLLTDEAVQVIKDELIPLATVLTPNLPEAEVLLQKKLSTSQEIIEGAYQLMKYGAKNVVMKGGHAEGDASADFVLLESGESFWLVSPRINTVNTHGTGDTFSSCIVAELAKGSSVKESIITAKKFIQGAIEDGIEIGHGHGPTNHWAELSDALQIQEVINC
ncbi:MAG: bifunctional hydroxymethylpyrimidine kinase/phosphomethylpyrimidine kinase [Enterococcus sp.]